MLSVSAVYSGMRVQSLPGIDLQLSTPYTLTELAQAVLEFFVSLGLTDNALRGKCHAGEGAAGLMGTNCQLSYANA